MKSTMFPFIKKCFHAAGLDVKRLSNTPEYSLLGLKNLTLRTIIDVGANEGQFSSKFRTLFPDAHLYCFEPSPVPFAKLQTWAISQKGMATVFNLALGDSEGTVMMHSHTAHSPSSSLLQTTRTCEDLYGFTREQSLLPVRVATMDDIMRDHFERLIPDICIKLDVQGFEDHVIQGGPETFARAKACILEVCLDNLYEQQASFGKLLGLMTGLGFRYAGNLEQTFAPDGHVVFIDAVFLR